MQNLTSMTHLTPTSIAPVLWNFTTLSRVILFVYVVGFVIVVCCLFFGLLFFFRLPKESYRYLYQGTVNLVVKINSELGTKCSYSLTLFCWGCNKT